MSYFGYQEYPRVLYGASGGYLEVNSDDDKQAAIDAGWLLLPPPAPAQSDVSLVSDESVTPTKAPGRKGSRAADRS
jgi:hypothetical protein